MHDYDNCFIWVIKTTNIFEQIEAHHQIKINDNNYLDILQNLNKYLEIDDVIYNNQNNQFLFNFVKAAKDNLDKEFITVFSEIISKEDLEKFNIESKNFCEIKEKIHEAFKKFFENSEKKLDQSLSKKFPKFSHNLHFLDYQDLLKECEESFDKFNKNEKNFTELHEKFLKKINKFICNDSFDLSFQMDILKPLVGAEAKNFIHKHFNQKNQNANNVLFADYDSNKFFNLEINENSKEFPKFLIIHEEQKSKNFFYPTLAGTIIYFPKSCEKLFTMFFDHSLDSVLEKIPLSRKIHPERRFEILFEFLANQNLKTNEELISFLNSNTYQELYEKYNEYYQEFINSPTKTIIDKRYMNAHFDFEHFTQKEILNDFYKGNPKSLDKKNPMHLMDENQEVLTTYKVSSAHNKANQSQISTWKQSSSKIEAVSKKNNIFEQINSDLNFLKNN